MAGDLRFAFRNVLTERQAEVARLMIQGKTNVQIAQEMGVRVENIRRHASNILVSTDSINRHAFYQKAAALGLLEGSNG